jgi:ectoine hydroxylase
VVANSEGLTERERAELDERGFVLLDDVLSPEEVAELAARIDEVHARYGGEPGTGRLEVRNCLAQHPAFLRLVDHPKLLPIVVELLGPNIKIRSTHLDVRPPLPPPLANHELGRDRPGEPEEWHVDGPLYGYPTVAGVLPMMEVKLGFFLSDLWEPNSGTLCLVPGTHRLDYRVLADPELRVPTEAVFKVRARAGAVILFRTGIWHCVAPNLSAHTRKVLYYAYTYRWVEASDYLTQSDALLATCTPVQRQLLGAAAVAGRPPLGSEPERLPCSFYWYTTPDDIPLVELYQTIVARRQESLAVAAPRDA